MNYLTAYGADAAPTGFLDKLKAWWGGMSTVEKAVYAVGGAVVVTGVAVLATRKTSYRPNKPRKRRGKMRANAKGGVDKRSTAAGRLKSMRRQVDDTIDQTFVSLRRAHAYGVPSSHIQESLNELALAKQANLRGDDVTARRLLTSAVNRVGLVTDLPELQARRGSRFAVVEAVSESGAPVKRRRWKVLADLPEDDRFLSNPAAPSASEVLAGLSAADRREMLKTPEGRDQLRKLREAERAEAEVESAEMSEVERAKSAARFDLMASDAVKMAMSPAAERELEAAAHRTAEQRAIFEGTYTQLKGGTLVGTGDKRRRAPATAGSRPASLMRTKAGGVKAVVRARQIVARAEEFPGLQGLGVTSTPMYGGRSGGPHEVVRPIYGDAPERLIGGAFKRVPYWYAGHDVMRQQEGEGVKEFKARAKAAGFTPVTPKGEGSKEPRVAVERPGWRYKMVPVEPGEVPPKKILLRKPVVGYEAVPPEQRYTREDVERLAFEQGMLEFKGVDPSDPRASVYLRQRRPDRKTQPWNWGFRRGVETAIEQTKFLRGMRPAPILPKEGERYPSYPQGYVDEPTRSEEVFSTARMVEARAPKGAAGRRLAGTRDLKLVYKLNTRRRAKRRRRSA